MAVTQRDNELAVTIEEANAAVAAVFDDLDPLNETEGLSYTWEGSSFALRKACCEKIVGFRKRFPSRKFMLDYINSVEQGDQDRAEQMSQEVIRLWNREHSSPVMYGMDLLMGEGMAAVLVGKLLEDYCDRPSPEYNIKIVQRLESGSEGCLFTPILDSDTDPAHASRRAKAILARGCKPGNDLIGFVQRGEWDTLASWVAADRTLVHFASSSGRERITKAMDAFEKKYFDTPNSTRDSALKRNIKNVLDFLAPAPSASSEKKKQ